MTAIISRMNQKLRAFELADQLVLLVYEHTREAPRSEQFGLTSQMRRAAVSVASNIVGGCARYSQSDYCRFRDMAYGSAREVAYRVTLATRLGFIHVDSGKALSTPAEETCRVLNGLIRSLRRES